MPLVVATYAIDEYRIGQAQGDLVRSVANNCNAISQIVAQVNTLESQLKASIDLIAEELAESNSRLEKLLTAIREDLPAIKEHAPKVLLVAGEFAIRDMED